MTGHGLRILMGPTMSTESHVTDFEPQNRTCEESWKRGGHSTRIAPRISPVSHFLIFSPVSHLDM